MHSLQNKKNISPKKTTLSEQISASYKLLVIIVISLNLIIGTLLLYIGSISTAQGYILKKLQIENDELYNTSKVLDAEIIKATTLEKILDSKQINKMTKSASSAFVKDGNVAKK